MKVAIHQPNYFPYPGFFQKIFLSEIFVVLDNVQFQFDITNRNKIIKKNGMWERIIVPVKKNQTHKKIIDIEINNEILWKELTFTKLHQSYNSSKYFSNYSSYFKKLYEKNWDMLFDLNLETIKKIIDFLGIKIEIIRESELNITGQSTERLVNICDSLNADVYVSGEGGKNYLNEKLFDEKNIKIEYQNYKPIEYDQIHSEKFIPNLSILDLLFNLGPSSLGLISKSNLSKN